MKVVYLLAFLALAHSELFTIYLQQDPSAKCLDGSPAALYFNPGAQSDKFVIYFQGGGLCRGDGLEQTLDYCYKRSFTDLGSSKNYPKTKNFDGHSYLSSNTQNPFHDWNRVYIPYCDGATHQGSRLEAISYKDRQMYFRGANNTLAHFKYLNDNFNLFQSNEIIITGTSAGGLASFVWGNYVYEHASHPEGVTIVPDSGTFILDFPSFYNDKTMMDYSAAGLKISNEQTPMPVKECVQRYPTQAECFQSGNLYEFIKPKMFVVQSQYDLWGLQQILQLRCLQGSTPASMAKCTDAEKAYIEKYRSRINEAISNITSVEKHGAWSVSCIQHGFLENGRYYENSKYRIPTDSGVEVNDALLAFMRGGERLYIDSVSWPSNSGCSGASQPETYLLRQ